MGSGSAATTAAQGSDQEKDRLENKMDPVAAALRNASALLLASIKAVNASLGPVVAGEAGAREVRDFSFISHAESLASQVSLSPLSVLGLPSSLDNMGRATVKIAISRLRTASSSERISLYSACLSAKSCARLCHPTDEDAPPALSIISPSPVLTRCYVGLDFGGSPARPSPLPEVLRGVPRQLEGQGRPEGSGAG